MLPGGVSLCTNAFGDRSSSATHRPHGGHGERLAGTHFRPYPAAMRRVLTGEGATRGAMAAGKGIRTMESMLVIVTMVLLLAWCEMLGRSGDAR